MTDTDFRADEDGGSLPADTAGEATADPVVVLESEMLALARRFRSLMAARARSVHPRLDGVCYPMLVILRRADAVAMSHLLAELMIEKSTLTRRIDSAARLGLVERIPDPADARARLVALTPAGRARLDDVHAEETEHLRSRVADWDRADIRTLASLLRRLDESMG